MSGLTRPPHSPEAQGNTLRLKLLGEFSVWLGQEPVPDAAFPRRKAKALLKLLALQPHHRLHRDQVMESLWPDLPIHSAEAQLYNTISQLRKALKEAESNLSAGNPLPLEAGEVILWPHGDVQTDVQTFQILVDRARLSRELDDLKSAVLSYPGDLLPGDLYEEWTQQPREALRETYLQLLLDLADASLTAGNYSEAHEAYQRVLQLDPVLEEAHRGLMRVYGTQGNQQRFELQYRTCREALAETLDAQPSAKTEVLYSELRDQFTPPHGAAAQPLKYTLPVRATPLVGRGAELATIGERLSDPTCRLLTVVGPGGIGKTSLAIEAAQQAASLFADGVYFIPLASVHAIDLLPSTIAEALGITFYGNEALDVQLLHHLRDRSALLLLDNAEHLVAGVALFTQLLEHAPGVKLLVTSREHLHLQGEWLFPLEGLQVPPVSAQGESEGSDATRLFVQCARRIRSNFALTAENTVAINRICRLTWGMPLAIELASSWLSTLSCQEIVEELEHSIDILASSRRDVPERHRSIRMVFEHSWGLMTPKERHLFARLAVFEGGFSRDAAKQVAGTSLSMLSEFISKSLVRKNASERYQVHEVLRQYAAERLAAYGLETEVRRAHAEFFANFLQSRGQKAIDVTEGQQLEEIAREMENIRRAWQWAAQHAIVSVLDKCADALYAFYDLRGWIGEGEEAFARAADGLRSTPDAAARRTRARVLARQGHFAHRLGHLDRAQDLFEESLGIFTELEDKAETAFTLDRLSLVRHELGDDDEAKELLKESLALRRERGDLYGVAVSLNNLGSFAFALREYADAEQFCHESFAIQRKLGVQKDAAISLQNLAGIAFATGRYQEAEEFLSAGLATALEIKHLVLTVLFYGNLGSVSAALGDSLASRDFFHHAFTTAAKAGTVSLIPNLLVSLSSSLKQQGEVESALEACILALHHSASTHETTSRAKYLLSLLAGELSADVVASVQEQGRAWKLENRLGALLGLEQEVQPT